MKFFKILVFFMTSLLSLHAAENIPALISSIEGVPEAIIAKHIDACSGQFIDTEVDLYLSGPDPIILQRNYESADFAAGRNPGSWRLLSHCFLVAGEDKEGKGCTIKSERHIQQHAYVGERLGSFLCYSGWKNTQTPLPCLLKLLSKNHATGLTNCARGEICGRTFLKNNQITYNQQGDSYEVLSGDGTLRIYRPCTIPTQRLFSSDLLNTFASFVQHPKFYHLEEEQLPSGNRIIYSYDSEGNPFSIAAYSSKETTPFSQVSFTYSKNAFRAVSDDGRQVVYHFASSGMAHLIKVERPDQPDVAYTYDPSIHRLVKRAFPDGSFLEIVYDSEKRVASLKDPDGEQARLSYSTYLTSVMHPSKIVQDYRYNAEKRLIAIETYDPQGEIYTKESWLWAKENNKCGLLAYKILEDGNKNIYKCQSYVYDEKGNPIEELLYGNLTGKPQEPIQYKSEGIPDLDEKECHRQTFAYSQDKYNLVTKQGDCKGNAVAFAYKPNTNLVSAKYILEKDRIRKRFFYFYNQDGIQTQVIEDDGYEQSSEAIYGISKRYFKRIIPNSKGFPEIIEDSYQLRNSNEKMLIKKLINTFDLQGHLLKQETYDSDGCYQFVIQRTYDIKGNLLSETDPIGQSVAYTYDSCNRKLSENAPHQRKLIRYEYDLKGRCISVHEDLDGLSFTTNTLFDICGNKIAVIDRFGNRTDHIYDPFGRVIQTLYPVVLDERGDAMRPAFNYKFNLFGHCIEIQDPKGYSTKTTFNLRGQPVRVDYPDGSYELYKYDSEGSLHRQSTRDQTIYVFEYDFLGRLINTERSTYDPNGSGRWISNTFNYYNAFNKIRTKNENGYTTLYEYDGAGRLIAEINPAGYGAEKEDQESHKKEYLYDSLSRPIAIKTWYGNRPTDFSLQVNEYDLLGNVIEERGEDAGGVVYWKKGFVYDSCNFLTQKISYQTEKPVLESITEFDGLGNPILIRDACGRETRIILDYFHTNDLGQKVFKKTQIDPAGGKTEMVYDAPGRLVLLSQKDPKGNTLLSREIFYDLNGNKSVEITKTPDKTFRVEWQYGPMNRLEATKVAAGAIEEKITTFTYTKLGQLASRLDSGEINPILYEYNYDATLKQISLQSGKAPDLLNNYSSDKNGNVTEAVSLGGIKVKRKYDAFDQIVKEDFKDEVGEYSICYSYDKMGRRTSITLPDGSLIQYAYDAFFPRTVSRVSPGGEVLFTHTYESFDLNGNLISETLLGYCGDRHYFYDLDGTKTAIEMDLVRERILQFGSLGEVLQIKTQIEDLPIPKEFSYDSLYQLIAEPEHIYSYDYLHNRTAKDQQKYLLDTANQLLSDDKLAYSYDKQGRLTQRGEWRHQFDPLGHLTLATKEQTQIAYVYDPFGRRLNRIHYELKDKNHKKISTDRFFYIGNEEVGRFQDGRLIDCKVIGAFDEPIAIIEKGELLAALCDLQGNLIALADPETRELVGYCQWSAFGELISKDGRTSPWGYQGKREDPFTHLIYFGARDYDPITGRWITPDPAGFIDGPNLYQYTWNNPFSFQDRWGLSGHEDYLYGEVENHCFCEQHRDCKRGGDFDNVNSLPYPSASIYTHKGALWNKSTIFDLGLPELPKGQVGFINGMATKESIAKDHAIYLAKLAGGYNIHAVYNPTHTAPIDIIGCADELYNYSITAPVHKLHQNWNAFFKNAGGKELYLQICHSEGAILVRNALLRYPEHLRKRIIVVAIAPGAYISQEMCYRSVHYVSTRDFVPLFDKSGRKICQDTIVRLNPHAEAGRHDHNFQSKTYKNAIKDEIEAFFEMARLW